MGVVYHARYLVWLDVARCDYLRHNGMSYRELEETGLRLAVSDVSIGNITYRQAQARLFQLAVAHAIVPQVITARDIQPHKVPGVIYNPHQIGLSTVAASQSLTTRRRPVRTFP